MVVADFAKSTTHSIYLRNGSNPVINSGHGAYADVPAIVSGQHSHPSHVPGQYSPRMRGKSEMEWKCRQIRNCCQEVNESCQLRQEEMFRLPSSNWKISEVFIKHQTPLPNAEYCRRPVQWNKCFAENEKHSRWSHEMVRVGAPTPQSNQQLPPTIIHYLTEFIYGSRSVALRIMNYLRIIHNIQSTRLFLSALSQLVAQPGSNEQGQN